MLTIRLGLLVGVVALSGCTGISGPPSRVQTASPSNITILTDPALRNLGEVLQVAKAHCAQYGRKAVQLGIGKLRGGQAPVSFACR
ncbi:MAG: hypothetical protein HIU92_02645 [Proteobacteria bacterium]|nr:hypothetical protein [Pseudomonadota bacterium]